jgi:hypothetical protein
MVAMAVDRASLPAALASRNPLRSRRLVALAIAAIAILATAGTVPSGAGAASMDPHGDELMRLTNLDRSALGKPPLVIDPTLASFARDLAWTCPTNSALLLRGRASDMADRSYFSHSILGCVGTGGTDMSVLDVMSQMLGYQTMRAENIHMNTYGTETATYAYGCAIDGTSCVGTTTTPRTVEVAERGFMQSSGHRASILNSYDRFGCGSELAENGRRYFACVFSLGGPVALPPSPEPSASPTPSPTPTPTPSPSAAPTPTPTPTPKPTSTPSPTPTSTPKPTPSPTPTPSTSPSASPTPSPSAAPPDPTSAPSPTPSSAPAVVADTTAPAFVRFTGTSTVRAGNRRTIGTTVTDDRGLARLEVRVDGRLAKSWSLSGTRADRTVVISASWLKVGRHQVRWTTRDAAGHARTRAYWLYVR